MAALHKNSNILAMRGSRHVKGKAAGRLGSEPVSLATNLEPPDWLNEEGRAQWARVIPLLHGMGVYGDADKIALGMLCDAVGEWIKYKTEVEQNGGLTLSEKGVLYQSPVVGLRNQAWQRAFLMLKQFGMTPVGRSAIGAAIGKNSKDTNPLDILLSD